MRLISPARVVSSIARMEVYMESKMKKLLQATKLTESQGRKRNLGYVDNGEKHNYFHQNSNAYKPLPQ